AGIAEVAEHLDDARNRLRVAARLRHEFGRDDLAFLRLCTPAGLDQQIVADTLVGGNDKPDAALLHQPADDVLLRALQHFDDARFAPAAPIHAARPRHDAVAVHDLLHFPGVEEVIVAAFVGDQKTEAVRVRLDATGDQLEFFRDQQLVLAIAQQLTLALHRGDAPRKAFGLFAGDGEQFGTPLFVDRHALLFESLEDVFATGKRLVVPGRLPFPIGIELLPRVDVLFRSRFH